MSSALHVKIFVQTQASAHQQEISWDNWEDIHLQAFLLLFKCANHWNKKNPFVTAANKALVETQITIADKNDFLAIKFFCFISISNLFSVNCK